jgi:hypothetical protein
VTIRRAASAARSHVIRDLTTENTKRAAGARATGVAELLGMGSPRALRARHMI